MKVQNFYENLSTLHVGTMDNRCWYVPKQDGRESQILLSGDDWKFAWYPSVEEVPEEYPTVVIDPFLTNQDVYQLQQLVSKLAG